MGVDYFIILVHMRPNATGTYFAEAVAKKLARGAILKDVKQGQTQLQNVRKRAY